MPPFHARRTIAGMSSPTLRKLLAGGAALIALAVAAPAASADSIAYVKAGDIWLSTSDGSRQYRVTATGGYSDVTQADNGTMIGLHGVRLHRLDRQGRVLADFDTPVSDTRPAPAKQFYGPYDPAISPDGKKVAYSFFWMTQSQSPTCFPPQCVIGINEGGTGYSWADRQTGWDDPALGKHTGWMFPSFVDNDTVLLSDPTHMPNYDVILDTISDGDTGNLVHNWFSDTAEGNPGVGGGDVSRDRKKMAFVTGENDSTLTVYSIASFPTTFPDSEAPASTRPGICYRYSGVAGRYSTPTFSPSGNQIAWSEDTGIKLVTVPSFAGGCTTAGATPNAPLVIPGGKNPDWGPANVPPGRGAHGGGGALTIKSANSKLRSALAKGIKLRIRVSGAGRVSAKATKAGRKVAAGAKSVRGGNATVKLRFTKAAKRSLKRAQSVKVRIKVAFKPTGGATQRQTVSLTLTR
jgi:WD40-like Beta Propeller Repeat